VEIGYSQELVQVDGHGKVVHCTLYYTVLTLLAILYGKVVHCTLYCAHCTCYTVLTLLAILYGKVVHCTLSCAHYTCYTVLTMLAILCSLCSLYCMER
jgi:hypothetical protein